MPRDPTPAQLRNLQYVERKPAFIQRILAGQTTDANGRVPPPERPTPADSGPDDDDDDLLGAIGDEAPSVVVLKEGKHLTAEDARREMRRAKGLPEEETAPSTAAPTAQSDLPAKKPLAKDLGLTFNTSSTPAKKRKAVAVGQDPDDVKSPAKAPSTSIGKKKQKQAKVGLSFE